MLDNADGYYDYAPTIALKKPLVLLGSPGVECRQIGHELASLTGLPLADVDHWVEHQAGQSVWSLVQTNGVDDYRRLQHQLLKKALSHQPCGIVVLADGALTEATNEALVLEQAVLVFFKQPLSSAYWKLRQRQSEGRSLHPLHPRPLVSLEQLKPFFAVRQQAAEKARLVVDMEGKTETQVVRLLLDKVAGLSAA